MILTCVSVILILMLTYTYYTLVNLKCEQDRYLSDTLQLQERSYLLVFSGNFKYQSLQSEYCSLSQILFS